MCVKLTKLSQKVQKKETLKKRSCYVSGYGRG